MPSHNKVEKVIKVIEGNKHWLLEAKAAAKHDAPLSFCQMKLAIKEAGLVYSHAFYTKLRRESISRFKVSSTGAS